MLQVGDTVYLKAVGNNARYDKKIRIEEYKIVKIGRKYFEVNDDTRYKPLKFRIEDMKQETGGYIADWELYFSHQEILDEEESKNLSWEIKNIFSGYGEVDLTLEQLRRIRDIINENKE